MRPSPFGLCTARNPVAVTGAGHLALCKPRSAAAAGSAPGTRAKGCNQQQLRYSRTRRALAPHIGRQPFARPADQRGVGASSLVSVCSRSHGAAAVCISRLSVEFDNLLSVVWAPVGCHATLLEAGFSDYGAELPSAVQLSCCRLDSVFRCTVLWLCRFNRLAALLPPACSERWGVVWTRGHCSCSCGPGLQSTADHSCWAAMLQSCCLGAVCLKPAPTSRCFIITLQWPVLSQAAAPLSLAAYTPPAFHLASACFGHGAEAWWHTVCTGLWC